MSVLALPRETPAATRSATLLRVFVRRKIVAVGAVLGLIPAGVGLVLPFAAVDPGRMDVAARLRAPSAMYWFGTDDLGRDVFARVVYGARLSLLVGVAVVAMSFVVGLTSGLAAGYFRGLDNVIMRIM